MAETGISDTSLVFQLQPRGKLLVVALLVIEILIQQLSTDI